MSQKTRGYFRTSDMALCAYLHLEGLGHYSVEKVTDNRAEMTFADNSDLREFLEQYRNGWARVEPREFQRKVGWVRGLLLEAVRPPESEPSETDLTAT